MTTNADNLTSPAAGCKWSVRWYTPDDSQLWDDFVRESKNGTFLFLRSYMDYHADRFADRSLVILDTGNKTAALLPATQVAPDCLSSHAGLTYGGFISRPDTRAQHPAQWLAAVKTFLSQQGYHKLIYKVVPHIYHTLPADEDLYALWRHGAEMSVCNLASVVPLDKPLSSRLGKRAARRMERYGISVSRTTCAADFWQIIVDDRRERHNTTPVHTVAEMQMLADRLPDNIHFYTASIGGRIVAGAVVYLFEKPGVIHLQYAAATHEAFNSYAVDAIYHSIVTGFLPGYRFFDFGTSNESAGRFLNTGMTAHKEDFGGRPVAYMQFTLRF